jgi:hypothetical protein
MQDIVSLRQEKIERWKKRRREVRVRRLSFIFNMTMTLEIMLWTFGRGHGALELLKSIEVASFKILEWFPQGLGGA